jgi:Ser/Thr protein kinase RdoA (MazF antagonist)
MFLRPILATTSEGKFVLRAHRFRASSDEFQFQAETLEHLKALGFGCPQIVRTHSGALGRKQDGVFWALHQFVEGHVYSWIEWKEQKLEGNFLFELGRDIAKVHDALAAITPGGDSRFSPALPPIQFALLRYIHRLWRIDLDRLQNTSGGSAPASRTVLARYKSQIADSWRIVVKASAKLKVRELTPQIVHGDVSPVNIVFTASGFFLIDWDCVHLGLRLYDALGDVLNRGPAEEMADAQFDEKQVQRYLEGYRSGTQREMTDAEARAIPLFCLARQLEDLRQRVAVLAALSRTEDEQHAVLIKGRVRMMESIKDCFTFSGIF